MQLPGYLGDCDSTFPNKDASYYNCVPGVFNMRLAQDAGTAGDSRALTTATYDLGCPFARETERTPECPFGSVHNVRKAEIAQRAAKQLLALRGIRSGATVVEGPRAVRAVVTRSHQAGEYDVTVSFAGGSAPLTQRGTQFCASCCDGRAACNPTPGRDFTDPAGPVLAAATAAECCALCRASAGCAAAVFAPNPHGAEGRCYTKTSAKHPVDKGPGSTIVGFALGKLPPAGTRIFGDFDGSSDGYQTFANGSVPVLQGMQATFSLKLDKPPTQIRYTANQGFPQCALYNAENLPAYPFVLDVERETVTTAPTLPCTANTTAADIVHGKSLKGQTVVITGGDSGIGFETALALASIDAVVYIMSYDANITGAAAAANITTATGNSDVYAIQADLSELSSVRAAAAELRKRAGVIDILICDAGIAVNPNSLPSVTADGWDRTFEVNYVGHTLLVELLLPQLRAASQGGRVIEVSSDASFDPCDWANRPSDCFALGSVEASGRKTPADGTNPEGVPASNYGLTKFLQVFHAAELAKREHKRANASGPGVNAVLAFSLHPGFVLTPMTRSSIPPAVVKEWCKGSPRPCPMGAAAGAATPTFLAVADRDGIAANNGLFFTWCGPATSVKDTMVKASGASAVETYQSLMYDLALSWVN